MRRILIVPVLLIMAVIRIVFHVAAGLLFLPYALLKRIADGAGSILKELVKGDRYVKAKKQPGEIVGSVASSVSQGE